VKRFTSHTTTVNDLDIDANGEYVASCSDDGTLSIFRPLKSTKSMSYPFETYFALFNEQSRPSGKVVVHHLYSNETAEYEYNGPIGSVALETYYPKSDKRELVCGGKTEKLVLNTKGWFGRKNEVLHAGEGPIHAVKWRGSMIAWANNLGVKMYDCNTEERIAYIDRAKFVHYPLFTFVNPVSLTAPTSLCRDAPRPDMYRCCLAWENDTDLIIGWGNFVKIGRVSPKPGTNTKHVQIIYSYATKRRIVILSFDGLRAIQLSALCRFQTDFFISGIAPFREELVMLAYNPADEQDQKAAGAKQIVRAPCHSLVVFANMLTRLSLFCSLETFQSLESCQERFEISLNCSHQTLSPFMNLNAANRQIID
jgi:vacuolar protein sorting-associated protein 41